MNASLFTRRDALKSTVAGFGYLAFSGLSTPAAQTANPQAPARRTHFPARGVDLLWP